jgi:cytochrome c
MTVRLAFTLSLCSAALAACSPGKPVDREAVKRGQVIFESCSACHALDGTVLVGPPLNGVVGRKVGSVEGYTYSDAFRTGGFTWTSEKLAAFLQNPESIPGTNMVATPLTEQDARDVVALLESRS